MKKRILFLGICGLLSLAGLQAIWAMGTEGESAIDPAGRPKKYGVAKETTYALWFADGMWHIRATTEKGKFSQFQGWVKIKDGELTEASWDHLEANKKKRYHDWVTTERDRKSFRFIFANSGNVDGMDFKVSDSATALTFSLLIDGKTPPENVMIGAKSVHPSKNPFDLPAHPEEPRPKSDGKKKKSNG